MTDAAVALADLGSRVIAMVVAAQRLGHKSPAMTAHYVHSADETGQVLVALVRGDSKAAADALRAWLDSNGLDVEEFVEQPA